MRRTAEMPAICTASTRSGKPCRNAVHPGEETCFFHLDPSHPARRESAARGGAARSNEARARRRAGDAEMTLADVRQLLGVSMTATIAGQIQPGVGSAMAALARAFVTVSEAGEIEERIARLEAAVAAREARA